MSQNQKLKSPLLEDKWTLVGWQGITLLVPKDWSVSHIKGDRKEGYMGLDDGEMMRVEVKWSTVPGEADLDKALESYLSAFERHGKKTKQPVQTKANTRLLSRRQVGGREVITFFWDFERIGHGLIWKCRDCERVVLAQVMGHRSEPVKELALKVLLTLSDHSDTPDEVWSVYGLRFRMPKDFILERQDLYPGRCALKFKRSEEERMELSRWGIADVLLKGISLEEWTAGLMKNYLKRYRIECRSARIKGHAGLELEGRPQLRVAPAQLFWRQLTKRGAPPALKALIWHCDDSNRILALIATMPPQKVEMVDEVASSVECH